MEIKIWNDKYIVRSDERQYILTLVADSGQKTDRDLAYFPSMDGLFKYVAAREARSNKCRTMDGYIKHIEGVNKELEKNVQAIASMVGTKKAFERAMIGAADELPESIKALGTKRKSKQ